jgi:hypothetical protein
MVSVNTCVAPDWPCTARSVTGPGVAPATIVVLARPLAPVMLCSAPTIALPDSTCQNTGTLASSAPFERATTVRFMAWPGCSVAPSLESSGLTSVSSGCGVEAAVAVSTKEAFAVVASLRVAVTCTGPASGPKRTSTSARPVLSVVVTGEFTVAPLLAVHVTCTPDAGWPLLRAKTTSVCGNSVLTGPLWLSPDPEDGLSSVRTSAAVRV